MPVKYDEKSGKWCMESNYNYKTKKDAEAAERAYHANKDKKVKKQITIREENFDIEKSTANDVYRLLQNAIEEQFLFENGYANIDDWDYEFAYILVRYSEYKGNDNYRYYSIIYKVPYKLENSTITLGTELIKVERTTKYEDIKEKNPLLYEDGNVNRSMEWVDDMINKAVDKIFKRKKKDDDNREINDIVKEKDGKLYIEKFNDEEMISYEPLYVSPDVADAVGESMSEEESLKMVKQIKEKIEDGIMEFNLFHKVKSNAATWVDAFSNPWPSCFVGDQEVLKSQPVGVLKWNNEKAWGLRKAGVIMGPSIEGKAGNKRLVEENSNE